MAADGATAFWSHQNYSKYACEQYNLDYMTDLAQIVEIDLTSNACNGVSVRVVRILSLQ
jgi:hypothetical protein